MVFSSPAFLFYFLPLFLVSYYALRDIHYRNIIFLIFSIIFYAWGEPVFVFVLIFSIFINWQIGYALTNCSRTSSQRILLFLALLWNLSILFFSKYVDFMILNLNAAIEPFGWYVAPINIALPLGVSFFTFQALSYVIDVYRKTAQAEQSFVRLALYLSMFPQLIAGPIVRYRTIAAQLQQRRTTILRCAIGIRIFIIGLAQKILIANQVGQLADVTFKLGPSLDLFEAWLGLLAFTLQIYFDFSGYSNMAIGIGLMLGFNLPRNFNMPYTARSVTDFWRRWHISLSLWFRDYLYIPLGGNRSGVRRTYTNLLIVFLLCGLWHGASWTFLIWGAFHGLFLINERAWLTSIIMRAPAALRSLYTLIVVMLGWVWFRAETLEEALLYYRSLFGLSGNGYLENDVIFALTPFFLVSAVIGVVLAVVPQAMLRALFSLFGRIALGRRVFGIVSMPTNALIDVGWLALLFLCLIGVAIGSYDPFLYSRF